ncbi:hypothetical protein [Nocardia sp. SC052]|uniref:hypothetical protein n=1 Tax=Nocardia sichangensis TaxID=3385975 RepID=UPI0039A16D40
MGRRSGGAEGYCRYNTVRVRLSHLRALTAGSNAGTALGELQPHLLPLADRVHARTTAAGPAGHDVIFLGLPHGQSAAIAAESPESTVIIDCGADFRLTDPNAWEIHR